MSDLGLSETFEEIASLRVKERQLQASWRLLCFSSAHNLARVAVEEALRPIHDRIGSLVDQHGEPRASSWERSA